MAKGYRNLLCVMQPLTYNNKSNKCLLHDFKLYKKMGINMTIIVDITILIIYLPDLKMSVMNLSWDAVQCLG